MDYVDLYQIHRWDRKTPIEETLEALDSLVRAGKVRYLGASSMAAWQLSKALHTANIHGWHSFVAMQNHYNLVYREEEREMIPLCMDEGLAVIPWSPLARGFLGGSRNRDGGSTLRAEKDTFARDLYFRDDDFTVAEAVKRVAADRGVAPRAGGSGLGAAGAWNHRADCGQHKSQPVEGTHRSRRVEAHSGRDYRTGEALQAA